MAKKNKAEQAAYMREYRKRKREERKGGKQEEPVTLAPKPPARSVPATQPRRRRVQSDKQIRAYIINAINNYGNNPMAFLNVMSGYVSDLQEKMKRDREDEFAEKACEQRHPGRMAQGVYCKLCHEVEMSGRFGSLPPEAGGTPKAGTEDGEDLSFSEEEQLLMGRGIKKVDE